MRYLIALICFMFCGGCTLSMTTAPTGVNKYRLGLSLPSVEVKTGNKNQRIGEEIHTGNEVPVPDGMIKVK